MTEATHGQIPDIEAIERLAFAEAALGVAGHKVNNPRLIKILERYARGEISGDEAREMSSNHILRK
ncbi:MAG: hypothetical protein CSA83_01925 [Actinomycetales bacterium]|nr:MAG: hypothetical protein CSA83_01925 [Actinomycetales bacterium]